MGARSWPLEAEPTPFVVAESSVPRVVTPYAMPALRALPRFRGPDAPPGSLQREKLYTTFTSGKAKNEPPSVGTTIARSAEKCSPSHRTPPVRIPPPLKM